jgi:hypothetical protein
VAARKKKNPSLLFDRRSLPRVPASRQAGTRIIWLFFAQFKQCSAPHGTLECACRWSSLQENCSQASTIFAWI